MERIIGHVDMDAFFASVEERDKPYLKGLPVIVGADPKEGAGRGVVSTANYEARKLGIGSALPIRTAWQLCEEHRAHGGARCVFITSGFSKYRTASHEVFAVLRELVPTVAQVSVDEAYLDFTHTKSYTKALTLGQHIQQTIKKRTGLTCSIGIGPNKMIAKIASDFNKPNGLTVVTPQDVHAFLAPLPVRRIPGVGKKATETFRRMGVHTIGDVQKYSWEALQAQFGTHGFSMWERVRGIDERAVVAEPAVRKSIGKHHTFSEDTRSREEVLLVVRKQCKSILAQVHARAFTSFRTVVLTVRFENFTTVTRSLTRDEPMTTQKDIELKATKLLLPFFEKTENPTNSAIRLVGVRVEKLM